MKKTPSSWSREARLPRRPLAALLVAVLAGTAAACSFPLQQSGPPARTYWLEPAEVEGVARLRAVEATAVPGLDTNRLLALDDDRQLVPYAGARWAGDLPDLVASVVARSLGARDPAGSVTLHLEIRRFFVERSAGSAGEAVVAVAAWRDGAAGAPETFRAREPVDTRRLGAVADAFQTALDRVVAELADWLAGTGAGAHATAGEQRTARDDQRKGPWKSAART